MFQGAAALTLVPANRRHSSSCTCWRSHEALMHFASEVRTGKTMSVNDSFVPHAAPFAPFEYSLSPSLHRFKPLQNCSYVVTLTTSCTGFVMNYLRQASVRQCHGLQHGLVEL